ncbi:hypothetical protein ACTI_42220 [Actinoplanes sp. OR16]|uniref:hypothetical protein n=1 Tax=Actinoplanes sp. OR16 TaxID=946334 RepID=UPI000F6E821E|nr:hypothetical protein [Actinoplanes sp. OR16]BBH67537.1 hypothetical protein ACTI_42220 [Actinoplanes sp. OR16]
MTVDRIPQDVEALVRDAAQASPGYGGDFAEIPRIARRQQRRRTAAVFAGVAAVLAVAGVGVAADRGPDPAPVDPPAVTPTTVTVPPGAQRLMLNGANGEYRTFDNGTMTYTELGRTQVGEFSVDGSWQWRLHQLTGPDRWDGVVGRADGSIVAAGPSGASTELVVVDAAGAIVQSRDLGEPVALVSADEKHAYLWRPSGLVEHTLSSGAERVVVPRELIEVDDVFGGQIVTADVANGLLALVRKATPCVVELYDLSGPDHAGMYTMAEDRTCSRVTGLRLSPDAKRVAVAMWFIEPGSGPHVEVLETDGGTNIGGTDVDVQPAEVDPLMAVAWVDDKTLRGVFFHASTSTASDLTPFTVVL